MDAGRDVALPPEEHPVFRPARLRPRIRRPEALLVVLPRQSRAVIGKIRPQIREARQIQQGQEDLDQVARVRLAKVLEHQEVREGQAEEEVAEAEHQLVVAVAGQQIPGGLNKFLSVKARTISPSLLRC